jgi:predicted acyltransferase
VNPASRLRSLDAFRGITIGAMLLVNNPGSWDYVYPPLEHAEWNGWTPTDLIFPFFLFIVGVALTYSLGRRAQEGADRAALLRKIAVRSATIVLVGVLLNGFPGYHLATLRLPGVLQRIGLVYLVAATLWISCTPAVIAWIVLLLLAGYWALMTLVPVPGYGPGVLEPVGNLAQYLDQLILRGHMWRAEWDPEGLLSTVPAVATCLIGALTGQWLRSQASGARVAAGMAIGGAALTTVGLVWGLWFPINKSLWTSSYVLFTAGVALLGLSACYWLIELRGRVGWARPAFAFGANPLIAFVGSGVMARLLLKARVDGGDGTLVSLQQWLYTRLCASWAGPLNGSLVYAVGFVLLWCGLMELLYRRGWRVRA